MADELGTCVECKLEKMGWRSQAANGFICRACYRRVYAPRERCGACGKHRIINARPDGVPHCEACYKRLLNRGTCVYCGRNRTVHARDAQKRPVCLNCYETHLGPVEVCMYCEKLKPPSLRSEDARAICRACWVRELHRAPCTDCGNDMPISTRTKTGEPLCSHCAVKRRTKERCPLCREKKPLLDRKNGERICEACWNRHRRPTHPCSGCGDDRVVAKWTEEGPVCSACWFHLKEPEVCAFCGQLRPVSHQRSDGRAICSTCRAKRQQGTLGEPRRVQDQGRARARRERDAGRAVK